MKIIFRKLHRLYTLSVVMVLFMLFYPLFYVYSRNEKYYQTLNKLRSIYCKLISIISGIIYKFELETELDWTKNYIVCANHTSNLDIVALCVLVNKNYFFIGKQELMEQLVTRLFFKTVDVPVNRENKISAFRAFKSASEKVKSGYNAIIFPEGKIGEEYPPVLHSFKEGAFKIAIDTNTYVLPISIVNNYKLFWDDGKKYGSSPGICKLYVHKPIETCNLQASNLESLINQTYNIIHSKLDYKKI